MLQKTPLKLAQDRKSVCRGHYIQHIHFSSHVWLNWHSTNNGFALCIPPTPDLGIICFSFCELESQSLENTLCSKGLCHHFFEAILYSILHIISTCTLLTKQLLSFWKETWPSFTQDCPSLLGSSRELEIRREPKTIWECLGRNEGVLSAF